VPPTGVPPTGVPPTPPLPPGGTPPAGLVAPPPGGTPPTPPSGAPLGGALDAAGNALSKAAELGGQADAARDELAPHEEPAEEEPAKDEGAASPDEAAAPSAPASDVDYSNTWKEPPPSSRIVITQVVHRPVRARPPAPAPEPSYEPRAHGFMGLSLRGTTTNRNPSTLTGGRLGFVFDDRFTIGGAFYSLTGRFGGPIVDPEGNKLGMRMHYGGVLLGWTLYKGRVMRLGLETLAGAGAACISTGRRSRGRWECVDKVGLVSLEPGLSLGFTVTDWVRVGLTGGYRFVTREAWRSPNDFTLSGPYIGLDIDFGAFRERGHS
jgi:hypothetical protein